MQKLSNKQSAKVICKLDRLRTVHSNSQTSHRRIGKLIISAYAFDYIVVRVNYGLTSCEDLAAALTSVTGTLLIHHNGPISSYVATVSWYIADCYFLFLFCHHNFKCGIYTRMRLPCRKHDYQTPL